MKKLIKKLLVDIYKNLTDLTKENQMQELILTDQSHIGTVDTHSMSHTV